MSNTTTINTRTELTDALNAVQKQRQDWEANAFAASNDKLYAILASALYICQACVANPDLTNGVDYLLELRGLKFSKNTSLELKVVRLVFADRDTQTKHKYRLLSYARVLNLALDAGQTSATLPQFIKDHGGIDEIRRVASGKKGEVEGKQFVSVASKTFSDPNRGGLFDPFKLPPELKPANGNRYSLALIRDNQDGTGSIVTGLKSNALVDKALEEAGKVLAKEHSKQAEKNLLTGAEKYQLTIRTQAADAINAALDPAAMLEEPATAAE
ncbi:hypothetical protein [Ostreiculturibacter nitratireducens]|uniref:hypothetical protein n=1 Tax=Ostreiculturibacter nitratireducens TaxID=3075226 RepID=UPI0031B61E1F